MLNRGHFRQVFKDHIRYLMSEGMSYTEAVSFLKRKLMEHAQTPDTG